MKSKHYFFPFFLLTILLSILIFIYLSNLSTPNNKVLTESDEILSFSNNILLSISDSVYPEHVEPTLTIGINDEIYTGWKEARGPSSGGVDVSFSKSDNMGQNWTIPSSMPSNLNKNGFKTDPWLQIYNNEIFYSYLEYNDNFNSQITVAKSSDSGLNWHTVKASNNTNFADKETFVISKNGTIFLTYDDIDSNNESVEIRLSKSTDFGLSFNDITRINDINNKNVISPYPALFSNQTLFVTWLGTNFSNTNLIDIYFDHSVDQGRTFNIDRDLNPETDIQVPNGQRGGGFPVIRFDSMDRLYVLWSDYAKNWNIFLKYSDDFGVNWSPNIPVNENVNTQQILPDMDIDKNNVVHITYFEIENSQFRPYYVSISFTGTDRKTFERSKVIPIADEFTSSGFIRPGDYYTIRVDSNFIPHVVWTDGRSGHLDIYYSHGIRSINSSQYLKQIGIFSSYYLRNNHNYLRDLTVFAFITTCIHIIWFLKKKINVLL
jgi:hypothetical protein